MAQLLTLKMPKRGPVTNFAASQSHTVERNVTSEIGGIGAELPPIPVKVGKHLRAVMPPKDANVFAQR